MLSSPLLMEIPWMFGGCCGRLLVYAAAQIGRECLKTKENMQRYGLTAIAFHWLMFALVVCVGTLGLLHDSWPRETQKFWINIHAILGLALWFTLFARLWWRIGHRPPPPVETGGALARRAAGIVHAALY